MKILYIGTYIPEENKLEYINYCSLAGNKFQRNLISNISEKNEIDILTCLEYPMLPNGKDLIIPRNVTNNNFKNMSFIKYINLPILKNITISINTFIYLMKNNKKYEMILTYNLFPPYLIPITLFKILFNIKIGSIIADLYIDVYKYDNILKRIAKKSRAYKERKLIKKLDFCIPITNHITSDLNFIGPVLNIEGGVDSNESNEIMQIKNRKYRQIVYTGTIDSVNGIEILVEVIRKLKDENIKFIIAGDGPLSGYLKENAEKLNNLNYIGRVSNEECMNLQKESDLLILTRPTNQKITRYTFPSKLHEYMLSGRPTLITRLAGIGEEYNKYINIIEVEDPDIIAKQIVLIFQNYEEYSQKAIKGKRYILKNKTWKQQGEKIYDFLEWILNK